MALLYRVEERGQDHAVDIPLIQDALIARPRSLRAVLRMLRGKGYVEKSGAGYRLTPAGRDRARMLVRSHRLWEQYLVSEAGWTADRIHDKAERLEHFTDGRLRQRLSEETSAPTVDPHGTPIPPDRRGG